MPNVKGVVLIARKDFVESAYGDEGWQKILMSLREPHVGVLRGQLLPFSWYPFSTNQALDNAICQVLASGDTGVFREMGRFSAEKNLGSVHATFVRGDDPHALIANSRAILRTYYDEGERVYERKGERACALITTGEGCYSRSDCETNLGWFERAVEIMGGRNVEAKEISCRGLGAERCEYHFSWD